MSKEVSAMFSFLLGLSTGIALGVLFAPKQAKKLEKILKKLWTISNIK